MQSIVNIECKVVFSKDVSPDLIYCRYFVVSLGLVLCLYFLLKFFNHFISFSCAELFLGNVAASALLLIMTFHIFGYFFVMRRVRNGRLGSSFFMVCLRLNDDWCRCHQFISGVSLSFIGCFFPCHYCWNGWRELRFVLFDQRPRR